MHKSLSQYSFSAPECKLRHPRKRSGSPDLTENVVLNAVFINRGCQLTLYHNIPKTGLMLHYTRDVQITGYPRIEQKAPDTNDIQRSLQNCGSSVQNLLYVTILASRSSRWLLDLWKYVDPCIILTFLYILYAITLFLFNCIHVILSLVQQIATLRQKIGPINKFHCTSHTSFQRPVNTTLQTRYDVVINRHLNHPHQHKLKSKNSWL